MGILQLKSVWTKSQTNEFTDSHVLMMRLEVLES
jgi:hypothetical protein